MFLSNPKRHSVQTNICGVRTIFEDFPVVYFSVFFHRADDYFAKYPHVKQHGAAFRISCG